jgi:hypothetical protein
MNLITFPQQEWSDIQTRFNSNQFVYTIRVDREYGRYEVGLRLKTEWDSVVEVRAVQKVSDCLAELQQAYPYYTELTTEMLQELNGYSEMDIIILQAV